MADDAAEELRERTIATRRVYEGRVVKLRVDQVELPGGRRSEREVIEHAGAVGAVALTDDWHVLLVRQWRYAVDQALLEIPAGTREPGESPEECMRRELVEEVGHRAGAMRFLAEVYVSPGYSAESIHLFLATDLQARTAAADYDENIEVVALPLDEALAMCRDGRIHDGKTVAGLLLAGDLLAR
ncbi:MAG TPA: NUDIX hydrolase [Armatimonadota bacterium]|nr:NUDIX hydrolase [Armatimonadota bacterium]